MPVRVAAREPGRRLSCPGSPDGVDIDRIGVFVGSGPPGGTGTSSWGSHRCSILPGDTRTRRCSMFQISMSVCGPAGHDPLLGLAGDPGNKLEVRVVVENGEVSSLSDGGDKGVDEGERQVLAA
jgi:hypothetical protein